MPKNNTISLTASQPHSLTASQPHSAHKPRIIVPIAFCADANYGKYLPVAVQSIIENSSAANHYRIIILDCGINPADLAVLTRQLKDKANFALQVYNITASLEKYKKLFHTHKKQSISAAAYARLLIPEQCREYNTLIYADIDMIFERDMAELMRMDLGENYIAAVPDIGDSPLPDFAPKEYVNSGLLLLNAKAWRENHLTERAISLLSARIFKKHDQDVINLICKGKVRRLDKSWNSIGEEPAKGRAVWHYAGVMKPWHSLTAPNAARWWRYAEQVESYPALHDAALHNKARLNMQKGSVCRRFCGIPLLRVKISSKSKKYYLFGLKGFHIAEIRNYVSQNRLCWYFCHIKIFSQKY